MGIIRLERKETNKSGLHQPTDVVAQQLVLPVQLKHVHTNPVVEEEARRASCHFVVVPLRICNEVINVRHMAKQRVDGNGLHLKPAAEFAGP